MKVFSSRQRSPDADSDTQLPQHAEKQIAARSRVLENMMRRALVPGMLTFFGAYAVAVLACISGLVG